MIEVRVTPKQDDLSEMKKEIEKVCEQAANKKLEEFNLLFQDHLSSLIIKLKPWLYWLQS